MIWEVSKHFPEDRILDLASDMAFILKTMEFSPESSKSLSTF